MNKIIKSLLLGVALLSSGSVFGQNAIDQAYSVGATGTVAATVFVPEGGRDNSFTKITEWNVVASETNTYCLVFEGLRQGKVATGTASSTNILTTFTNGFGWGDYVIVRNGTNGPSFKPQYQLKQIISVSSTNIGLADAYTTALTAGDPFWICAKPYERRVMTWAQTGPAQTNFVAFTPQCEFYMSGPGKYPCAIMATNAAAAQIRLNISGVKIRPTQ